MGRPGRLARVSRTTRRWLAARLAVVGLALAASLFSACRRAPASDRPAPPSFDHLARSHARILGEMTAIYRRNDGLSESADRELVALARRAWNVAGTWVCAYLDRHPGVPAARLVDAAGQLGPKATETNIAVHAKDDQFGVSADSLPLGRAAFLVTIRYQTQRSLFNTFFVVARRPSGRWEVAWRVLDLADPHFESRDEIGRWAFLTAEHTYGDGPLRCEPRALPPDRSGNPRFYVNAWSVGDGGTRLWQLSVWKWTGAQALPLLIAPYYTSNESDPDRFEGDRIVVTTKEETRTMGSCGQCIEPVGRWTIRVTPDGVEDEGRRLVEPNYGVVDDLLLRVAQRKDATELAAPAVVKTLTRMIPRQGTRDWHLPFGLLEQGRTVTAGGRDRFDISFDDAAFRFHIERRAGRPFVAAMKVLHWYP